MLLSIQQHNKNIALQVLQNAMKSNPNLLWMTGTCKKRLSHLYEFCLQLAMLHKGAYLHTDAKGVVLFYKRRSGLSFIHFIKKIFLYLFFAVFVVDARKFLEICKLQNKIKNKTPDVPHLYCLIMAVKPEDKSTQTIIQMRDFLFQESEKLQLPIYIQTSMRRNKILFERYGFECYDTIENTSGDYTLWLLKRDYEKRRTTTEV